MKDACAWEDEGFGNINLTVIEIRERSFIGDDRILIPVVLKRNKMIDIISNSNQQISLSGLNDGIYAISRQVK